VKIGASVALNGTCLTVTTAEDKVLRFDIIPETLSRTNLGKLHLGAAVNFERSVKFGDEVGGHNVSGHVQTTAEIVALERKQDNATLTFRVKDPEWMKFIMPKGFIAVDGCSLTVGEVWFARECSARAAGHSISSQGLFAYSRISASRLTDQL
jgi:riboflavin synthase